MLTSLRSALVVCATLATISVAPAQADPGTEPLILMTSASLAQVRVPDLIDSRGEPDLFQPPETSPADEPDLQVSQPAAARVTTTGVPSELVAQFNAPEAGTRELDCLV